MIVTHAPDMVSLLVPHGGKIIAMIGHNSLTALNAVNAAPELYGL
jgi:hypothetical protein